MASVDQTFQDRFTRQQSRSGERAAANLQTKLGQTMKPRPVISTLMDKIPDWLKSANEALYGLVAKVNDRRHLSAVSREIDARFRSAAGGVLLRRITKRVAGEGGFQPIYVGLQVVGQGDTEMSAIADYEDRLARATETGRYAPATPTICTPQNPTGERLKAQATISATPEGFNVGYGSAIAAAVSDAMSSNPRNAGEISFGPHASPIQPKAYLEFAYLFITKKQWDGVKSFLN